MTKNINKNQFQKQVFFHSYNPIIIIFFEVETLQLFTLGKPTFSQLPQFFSSLVLSFVLFIASCQTTDIL